MFYRFKLLLICLLVAKNLSAQYTLEPPDTSSPQATIKSFLVLHEESLQRYTDYYKAPSQSTYNALHQSHRKGWRLLDLSQIPPAARREVAAENSLLLRDILARVGFPELSNIPDALAIKRADEKGKPLMRWRIPGTEITLARVQEGPLTGEYLFSPDTMARLRSFHESARQLPYQHPMPTGDLVRAGQLFTGWMIPLSWVEALPDWANTSIYGQVLWKWFAILLLIALAFAVVITVFRWGRRKPWDSAIRSYLRRISTPLTIFLLSPLLQFLIRKQINTTGSAAQLPDYIIEFATGVALVWLIWSTANWIAEAIISKPRIMAKSLDASLIRLAARSTGAVAIIVLIFRVAHDIGIPVYGLVAGAGISGLAIALAARSTLENFIGTLNLYADRPVRVGDFCRYGEDPSPSLQYIGTIEEIGLRSTRIRGLDRSITTIPNAQFSDIHIINLSERDQRLFKTMLPLRFDTSSEQLRYIIAKLRELLLGHPKVDPEPARVRFVGYAQYSKNIEVYAYLRCQGHDTFLAIQEDILLRIEDIIKAAGTSFALPSQTTLIGRSSELDDKKRKEAESMVESWRARGKLPFPEFEEDERERLEDILDYPPQGSPDFQPRDNLSESNKEARKAKQDPDIQK